MTDKLSPERRSKNMSAIRSKDMKPELAVRRMVHRLGYRYRLHSKSLPGTPDMVFHSRHSVIFVNGCFWHQHPDPFCKDARKPKSNADYWQPKLVRNQVRDAENEAALKAEGWSILVIWECQTRDKLALEQIILSFLAT
ncbi:MAG: very short patch repair endonuclease [Deltaproteobacteria bacterium]|nr:very short patch repair endonuclease [Deltaproteobacteria bacterium]